MKKLSIKHKNFILIFLILLLLLSGVVGAWYVVNSEASAKGLAMGVDTANGLIVKMKVENNGSNTEDKVLMEKINADGEIIDIGLVKLTNIQDGMLAPGAFGEIHIYITSLSPYYNSYEIEIEPEYEYIEGLEDIKSIQNGVLTPVITEDKLAKIIDNHILFFTDRDVNKEDLVTYSGRMDYDTINNTAAYTRGGLELNNEKEVVIYWYWPYDYNDISQYLDADSPLLANGNLEDNIRNYDLEDTKIGNYLKSITINFKVKGTQNSQ